MDTEAPEEDQLELELSPQAFSVERMYEDGETFEKKEHSHGHGHGHAH